MVASTFAANRKRPAGSIARDSGLVVVAKGEPEIGASAPLEALSEYADTLLAPSLATKAKVSVGSIASDTGPAPAPNGDPDVLLNMPLAKSMRNTVTLSPVKF